MHHWTKKDFNLYERTLMSLVFWGLHLRPKSTWIKDFQTDQNMKLARKLKQNRGSGAFLNLPLEVDRLKTLSPSDFYNTYVKTHTPVIFDGIACDWDCVQKWNLEQLKEKHGSTSVVIVSRDGLTDLGEKAPDQNGKEFSEKITIENLITQILNGGRKFLRFSPLLESNPEFKADLNHNWLKKMRHSFFGASYQTFIGPANMKTPLHGGESTAFFYIMVDGEKTWDLIPAGYYSMIRSNTNGYGYNFSKINLSQIDETEFPGAKDMIRWRCHLKKGDILYVPSWMWHEVHNLTASWGISYRFISIKSMLLEKTFLFVRLFLTKPSIPKVIYLSFFKKNLPDREDHLLTPSLSRD